MAVYCIGYHNTKKKINTIDWPKQASNDFGCICEHIWKDQCSMEVYITIHRTKWYCPKLLIKLVITTKNSFYIHYATWVSCCHWLQVSKGQTILLQWCDLTSSGDGSTLSGDCSTIRIKSNTIKMMWYKLHFIRNSQLIYVHNMGDRNPKSMVYTNAFPRRNGRSKDFCLS